MAYNPNNPNGQATSASSAPVVIASDQPPINTSMPDMYVIGQSAQTAVVNNILTAVAGSSATDAMAYKSATVQVVSTATGGTFIFEGSNDNVNFQTIPVFSQLLLTGTPIVAAVTATASQLAYTLPVSVRYLRLRIVSTITGGSIQAYTRLTQTSWTASIVQIAQSAPANLQTTATIASGTITTVGTVTTVGAVTTVGSVTSAQAAIPGIIIDVVSAALTTTTTTATIIPTFGSSYAVTIPVTVVSGTTPTLDVQIQESDDSGTNWVPIFDFPRITAVGFYRCPMLPLTGNRVRYVQTVSGTTPSFTRAINRLQSSLSSYGPYRQQVDRSIVLTTLNSTTPSLTTGGGSRAQISISLGAASTPPAIQLEGSDDVGTTWYAIGSPLTATANGTASQTTTNVSAQFLRGRVSTVGVTVTPNYVLVRSY